MSGRSRSEERFAGWLLSASTVAGPVRSVGVWQSVHPIAPKTTRPRAIDTKPPGVFGDGRGGARNGIKTPNLSVWLSTSALGPPVSITSLGVVANRQLGVGSRARWHGWPMRPGSTYESAPAQARRDSFC